LQAEFTGVQHRKCPEHFQTYLTERFGRNRYGGPNIRIVWGQNETVVHATDYGYKRMRKTNKPCWVIEIWRGPEMFGTPKLYYSQMSDPRTGLALMGQFPYKGFYDPMIELMSKSFNAVKKTLEIKALPLTRTFLRHIAHILKTALAMTIAEGKLAHEVMKKRKHQEQVIKIADRLEHALPSFYGPVSYANQGNRTHWLAERERVIEQEWKRRGFHKGRSPQRGIFQVN
jgi:hypothetical protein